MWDCLLSGLRSNSTERWWAVFHYPLWLNFKVCFNQTRFSGLAHGAMRPDSDQMILNTNNLFCNPVTDVTHMASSQIRKDYPILNHVNLPQNQSDNDCLLALAVLSYNTFVSFDSLSRFQQVHPSNWQPQQPPTLACHLGKTLLIFLLLFACFLSVVIFNWSICCVIQLLQTSWIKMTVAWIPSYSGLRMNSVLICGGRKSSEHTPQINWIGRTKPKSVSLLL